MPITDYIEKELIGKRFILALLLVGLFSFGHISEGILGAVIGFYFRDHVPGGGTASA
ncbi:MAG: hypothetical protein PHG75_06340 [Syntrophomonas sp.]|nr:hypothetical protein [Syntrophomonas sp.]